MRRTCILVVSAYLFYLALWLVLLQCVAFVDFRSFFIFLFHIFETAGLVILVATRMAVVVWWMCSVFFVILLVYFSVDLTPRTLGWDIWFNSFVVLSPAALGLLLWLPTRVLPVKVAEPASLFLFVTPQARLSTSVIFSGSFDEFPVLSVYTRVMVVPGAFAAPCAKILPSFDAMLNVAKLNLHPNLAVSAPSFKPTDAISSVPAIWAYLFCGLSSVLGYVSVNFALGGVPHLLGAIFSFLGGCATNFTCCSAGITKPSVGVICSFFVGASAGAAPCFMTSTPNLPPSAAATCMAPTSILGAEVLPDAFFYRTTARVSGEQAVLLSLARFEALLILPSACVSVALPQPTGLAVFPVAQCTSYECKHTSLDSGVNFAELAWLKETRDLKLHGRYFFDYFDQFNTSYTADYILNNGSRMPNGSWATEPDFCTKNILLNTYVETLYVEYLITHFREHYNMFNKEERLEKAQVIAGYVGQTFHPLYTPLSFEFRFRLHLHLHDRFLAGSEGFNGVGTHPYLDLARNQFESLYLALEKDCNNFIASPTGRALNAGSVDVIDLSGL